ncbi:AraC family transcriptional regulator [Paenibacillus methanolicus]|uniref:AraC-like DNA-binding protein n=1 Tax=Paenibacillus methanolicus TaxID=582686 RepID=A0A5S5CIX3_9BACL|nr:AraC family transcriptional regulator [Paenibacillus methanolicus]TYP78156.1 AraC-like DNA-binding protein [Paenibacillus methanolicus]
MAEVAFYRDEALPFLEGKRCTRGDLAYRKHFHEEYSVGLIDSGRTRAWCDGAVHQVEKGRVISFPPLMLHACQPESDADWTYSMLFIRPEWMMLSEGGEADRLDMPYLPGDGKNAACAALIRDAMDAISGKGTPLEAETALIGLVQTLSGYGRGDRGHARRPLGERKHAERVRDYLQTHYMDRVTLEQLEGATGISRFHLIRLFKRECHLPPHAYQNLLRINHAKAELAKRRPIADIAAETGFYDQSHFSRAFARIVGATPGKYAVSR